MISTEDALAEPSVLQRLPTHERRLDNGLTVLVREDHSAPVVAVVTHVQAGYFDEPDHLVGISHVLEHMYFKGTERRGAGEIARETKDAGGYLNAGTIYDRTSYYTVVPANALEQALDIQADALQRSAVAEEELRKELLVIVQEAKRKLDDPRAVSHETLFETMFDVHRIRRWRIGSEEMLHGFTRADVWSFYRTHYCAANTVLVIAGDVDPERAFALVARHYGAMAAGEVARDPAPEEPERREFRYREISGDITQSYAQWGWRTPGTLHEDTPALDVLAIALGQGRASALYRHVRDAGVVAAVSAYNYTPTALGIFGVSAELEPADTQAAFERIAAVVQDALTHGVSDAAVERARNLLEARLVRRLETVEGQANLLASWQALGDWRLADAYLADVLAMTSEQVNDAARRYLDPNALTILLYRPRSAPVFASDPRALAETLFASRAPARLPSEERPASAPAARLPARLEPVEIEDGVRFYALDRGGAHIVIKPRLTAPLVSIALHARGGSIAESVPLAGITALMARTSVKGTRTRTATQLAAATEALGATITPGVGADGMEWSISVPARHFDAGLELLLDAALAPAFRLEDAERERKITLSDLEQVRDDMYEYPRRLALSTAFPEHPYGFSLEALEASLRGLDVARLSGWHAARVLGGAPYVLVVGDVADPNAAAARIAELLASALHEPHGFEARPPHWPPVPLQRLEQRERAQTAFVLAFPGPPRNHPDVHTLQVMAAAIGGLGGRLFEELRSRRSLAYTVTAAPIARWLGGAFLAYIGTSPEREDEARSALELELMRLGEELLPEADILRAQRYLIGTWQIGQQTHARQLSDLAQALLLGEGLAELREYEQRIRAVTAERIRAAAARWLVPDRQIEGIVRGTGGGR
jgi:zinc protease